MAIFYNPWVMFGLFLAALVIGSVIKLKWYSQPKQAEDQKSMQLNVGVVAVVVAVVLLSLLSIPSLSIDIDGIFTYAFDVVNAFMPLIAIIAGLGLGFNLIGKISSLFNRAL